jgi:uncharacterized protein (DUF1800 family)
VDALYAKGLDGAVDALVDYEKIPWEHAAPLGIDVRTPPGRNALAAGSADERKKLQQEFRRLDRRQARDLKEWWLRRMIATPRPLEERMTLFWHGHFTSAYRSVRNSYRMYVQNTTLRGLATTNFRALLQEISRDPAMLRFLDGDRNRKGQPNENFAREVMELFTLGEGNYHEDDIKEAARAFTGWTVRDGDFVYDPRFHDDGTKYVLGHRGRFDGQDVLEILLSKREASKFLARKLIRQFVGEDPDPDLVDDLALVLRREDYAIKPALKALFRSRAFYAPAAMGTKVKSPVDLVVGLYRTLGIEPGPEIPLSQVTAFLGQDILDPPNVKGWDGGRAWITTSHLLGRYNVAVALVGEAADRRALAEEGIRARGMVAGPPWYDARADVAVRGLDTTAAVVDHYVLRLLPRPMGPEARQTLIDDLGGDGPFAASSAASAERLHGLLRLIVSTPEFQLE